MENTTQVYGTLCTNIGNAAIANSVLNGVKVNFSQIAVGDANGIPYTPTADQTALRHQVWSGAIAEVQQDSQQANRMILHAVLPSSVGGWTMREIGVLDNQNRLIAIGNTPEIPKESTTSGAIMEVDLYIYITVIDARGVNVVIDPTVVIASKADIQKVQKAMDDYKTSASGTFVPQTREINSKPLSADIVLAASDVGAAPSSHVLDTVAHMTQAQKDQLSAAVPDERKINGHDLSSDVALTASDVSATPASHIGETVSTEGGVHGIRWYGGKLQAKDSNNAWADVSAGSDLNFSGTLVVKVTTADGKSLGSTRVRVRNEQLGSNYVQSLDALGETTFTLLDNHSYYVVLLDYPSTYYGAAGTIQIVGGQTQELDLTLKTEPDIIGWDMDLSTGEITYTDGASDHTPMSISAGALDPGSWANSWLTKMKPCLLKNGVVQYYLKNTGTFLYDYTKQANGSAADIASGDDGDVMIEFPLVYYKFYSSTDTNGHAHIGCKYSQIAQDDTWCANAFLDRKGTIQSVMYMAAYDGCALNNKLRSLSGAAPVASQTFGAFRTLANANGNGYEQREFEKNQFAASLLPMLFKGVDGQALVGKGATSVSAAISAGTMNDKPLFWGDQTGTAGVKFCGIENFWGNIYKWLDGIGFMSSNYGYKLYAPYNDSMSGYTNSGVPVPATGYIDTMSAANGYGLAPKTTVSAETNSKFHDYSYQINSSDPLVVVGGSWGDGVGAGPFDWGGVSASSSDSYVGASLSFTPQS